MITTIDNGILCVSVSKAGAELQSVTSQDGIEYIWNGDERHWTGRAPILFPIVGALRDCKANSVQGEIRLEQHGFARKSEWEFVESSFDFVTYVLKSSEKTKAQYPYDFELYVRYELLGSSVFTTFTVKNTGEHTMPYTIGGHTGFNLPLVDGDYFDSYFIQFDQNEIIDCENIDLEKGLIFDKSVNRLITESREFQLTHPLFKGDALVMKNLNSTNLKLISKRSGRGVSLEFSDFDYLGIWTTRKDAPFVCLEPWTGTATTESETDNFESKRGMKLLRKEHEDKLSFLLTFF